MTFFRVRTILAGQTVRKLCTLLFMDSYQGPGGMVFEGTHECDGCGECRPEACCICGTELPEGWAKALDADVCFGCLDIEDRIDVQQMIDRGECPPMEVR